MESEFKELDAKRGWTALYQAIRSESGQFDYTIKEAKKVENKNLNRYRDVSPYDHSRVKLQRGDCDYINASLLEVPDAHRAYILTQGPLPNTTSHFWQMVWEQNSKAVLMLNKVIEKNTIKCHQYWPLGSGNNGEDVLNLEQVGLCVKHISEKEASYYTVRHLQLVDMKTGDSRIVLHFHYTTWPDFSVPQSPSAFLNFLFAVRDSGALNTNVGPPVVHCSAGIGRSGTFCLVDSCLVLIEKYQALDAVDIKKMLLEMRKYRMGLIQTPDQLRFSYLAIIEGSHRVLNNKLTGGRQHSGGDNTLDVGINNITTLELIKTAGPNDVVNDNNCANIKDDDNNDSDGTDKDEGNSAISAFSSCTCYHSESVPSLPTKRIRLGCNTTNDVNHECYYKEEKDVHSNMNNSVQNSAVKEGCENNLKTVQDTDRRESQEACTMTMKDGAVVTNFNEKLKEAELRQRQRKERNEKMREKVKEIQLKQRESEKWRHRKSFLKPISVSLLILLGGGYLVYRYFMKD